MDPELPDDFAPDTDVVMTVEEMAAAWNAITSPAPDDVGIGFEPDDYPLF